MRYKLKKDTIGQNAGLEFEYIPPISVKHIDGEKIPTLINLIIAIGIDNTEYFEKIEEEESPKFKVGDYAVREDTEGNIRYIKIFDIVEEGKQTIYNYYKYSQIRKPTQEELQKYYR